MAAVLCSIRAIAQPYCDVRTFTIRDGLAANIISGFMQTPDGLMWMSTWNGLCYYDGYRFATFRNSAEQGMVLSTNRIMLIKPGSKGDIWCGTSDRHVYLFDTQANRFIDVTAMIRERFGHDVPVRSIYPLANGHTWLISNDASACYRVSDSLISTGAGIEQFSVDNGTLPSNLLSKVELDGQGREWIFSDRGVAMAGARMRSYFSAEYMAQAGNNLYFASTDGRLFLFDPRHRAMQPVAMPHGVVRINAVEQLDGGNLLLATNVGIVAYDVRRGGMRVLNVQTPSQPSSEVTSIYVDRKHRIWAFTPSRGVVLLPGRNLSPRWLMADADRP